MTYKYSNNGFDEEARRIIADIEFGSFRDPWNETVIKETAESGYVSFLTAFTESEPVGFSCIQEVLGEAEILRIAVRPEFRGMGMGRSILRETLSYIMKRGNICVFLEVRERNAAARNLYLSENFTEIAVRRNYYKNGENAVVMRLDINKK